MKRPSMKSGIVVFSLALATMVTTAALVMSSAPCGPSITDACRWSTGNPCPSSSQCIALPWGECCNTITDTLANYEKDTTLLIGDYYRCSQTQSSTGACDETLKTCANTTLYKDGLCLLSCKYTGIYQECNANPLAQICGDPWPVRTFGKLTKLVLWAMGR